MSIFTNFVKTNFSKKLETVESLDNNNRIERNPLKKWKTKVQNLT